MLHNADSAADAADAADAAADTKIKFIEELKLINAWDAISTNNKLDTKKLNLENLQTIYNVLAEKYTHTFNDDKYFIPDGQFNNLIKAIINIGIGVDQSVIKRHNDERSDRIGKTNKIYSDVSKKMEGEKMVGWQENKKTRKRQKGKKRKTHKKRKERKENKKRKKRKKRQERTIINTRFIYYFVLFYLNNI